MAIGGAAELAGGLPHIGAGNDTPHAMLASENGSCLAAGIVQLIQGNPVFVGCHLEHRVGRGVDNPLAGLLLLLAVVPNHIGAGIGQIAQHTPSGLLFKFLQHLLGEALGVGGQRIGRHNARNFPMSDGGILAHGCFLQPCQCGGGMVGFGKIVDAVQIAKTGFNQMGDGELGGCSAGAQGIHPDVPEGCAVRCGTHAAGVQHNQENPLYHVTGSPWQLPHPVPPSSWW